MRYRIAGPLAGPVIVIGALLTLAACGGGEPADTPVPPTFTATEAPAVIPPATAMSTVTAAPTTAPLQPTGTRATTPILAPTQTPPEETAVPAPAPDVPRPQSPGALDAVDDFLYQLQGLDLAAVGDSNYDLVVMDYSRDGTSAGEYSREEIQALKNSPGGPKVVLAYMSIGEAEDYRFYWQAGWRRGTPEWLDRVNPDWAGNYKVHYWVPEWQSIVLGYTDRLLAVGFDGAYLDIIDAFEYFQDLGRETAAQDMADFVAALREHVQAAGATFYLVPQNAPELAAIVPEYLDSIDGIAQEDIYFGYDEDDQTTPPEITGGLEENLDLFRSAGKLVLTVDYADSPEKVREAYRRSRAKGYVPFVTVRGLDQLTVNQGNEPD